MVKSIPSILLIVSAVFFWRCSRVTEPNTAPTSVVTHIFWKVGNSAVTLSDSLGVDSVQITLSSAQMGSPVVRTVPYSAHAITFDDIPSGSDITLRVLGIGRLGDTLFQGSASQTNISGPLVIIPITATQVTPIAPDSLNAIALSYKAIRLTWRDRSSNETYFVVSRRSGTGGYVVIDTLRFNATSFDDTGLSSHTAYSYEVYGGNATGRSIATNITATATTLSQTAWAPPYFTAAGRANLAGVDTVLVGQELRRHLDAKDDNGFAMTFAASVPLSIAAPDTILWVPAASDKGIHQVWVNVADSAGVGDSVKWQIVVIDTPVPAVPAISSIAADSGSVTVYWNNVSAATSYNLYYRAAPTVDRSNGTKLTGTIASLKVTGLTNNNQYAFAVSAVNSTGESGLSAVKTATPISESQTVTDIDGNVYRTVTIGTQVWMAENLKTTRLNDGTVILALPDSSAWIAGTASALCWYGNDSIDNRATYGALYNWFAVSSGKLAPIGWHIPTSAEWDTLVLFAGGDSVAGYKLKEIGNSHWAPVPTGDEATQITISTDPFRFTALPAGLRSGSTGRFLSDAWDGFWWAPKSLSDTGAIPCRFLDWKSDAVLSSAYPGSSGLSVRCVKN